MKLPILNKLMWACFDSSGNILWSTIDWTKEASEAKGKGRAHVCVMVAVDVETVDL